MYIGMRGHDFDTNTLDALCEKCKEYGVGGSGVAYGIDLFPGARF